VHPSLHAQLADIKTAEFRRCAATTAVVGAPRPAPRWPRWLCWITTPPAGGRPEGDPCEVAIRSSRSRITNNSVSAER
jgi:hypothetical protein